MDLKQPGASRRDFIKTTAAAGAAGLGFWVAGGIAAKASTSPNGKLQVAGCGVNGKGLSDVRNASRFGKIYAVCDVDRKFLDQSARIYKTEHKFTDFREMLDRMGDKIDVVTVSTPDHCHAVIASKAMKMGKHVYCQKPLTKSIWEARELQRIAKETGVVTQMGNQYTSFTPMRKAAYQIKAGQVGTVKEVHVWTNRPVWLQGEAWLGPAAYRPYGEGYHTFKWRGWWDFGTGALGDMACHTCNLPFMALNMRDAVTAEAESSGHNGDSYPAKSKIKFEFPALDGRAAFTLYWYDGTNLPPKDLYAKFIEGTTADGQPKKLNPSGCIIVGDKATLYAAGDYANEGIELSTKDPWLEVDYPKPVAEEDLGHMQEFFAGINDRSKKPMSNIDDYGGQLTETILLGNLAVWKPGKVTWDAKTLTPSDPSLVKIVKPEFRYGYEL